MFDGAASELGDAAAVDILVAIRLCVIAVYPVRAGFSRHD